MQTTEKVVVQLIVDGDGSLRTLKNFDNAMTESANASVKAGAGVDAYTAQMRRMRAAQEAGIPVLKARAAAMSYEEKVLASVFGKADAVARARITAERDLGRAAAAASNMVIQGKMTEADATRMLIAIEQQHAASIDRAVADAARLAAANDTVAASHMRVGKSYNASMARQNLLYQGSDIAVSLAGGINPAMVAMQQLPQILQGPGGVNAVLKETGNLAAMAVTRFGPLAAAVGAGSLAIEGMRQEIEEASGVSVSFGDVALAVWQNFSDGVYGLLKPAIDAIGGWFSAAWEWVKTATKDAGNAIIRAIVGSIEYVKAVVASIPPAFIMAGEAAANGFVKAINWMVEQSVGGINALIDGMNALGEAMGGAFEIARIEAPKFEAIDIGGAKAAEDYAAAWKDYANTVAALNDRDILGEYFGDIRQRAIENATNRLVENEEATRGVGRAAEAAAKQSDAHRKALEEQAKAAEELGKSIEQALGGAVQSLFDGPITGLDDALDRILGSFAQLGNSNLGNVFNGLLSPNGATGGQYGDGFWGSAIFDIEGAVRDGAQAGTSGGIFDGLGSLLGGKNGAQFGAMASAGLGGLGMGYQTQNPLMGGLGGALSGFAAGGPAGALVGGISGKAGGLMTLIKQTEKARRCGEPSFSQPEEQKDDRNHLHIAA